MFSITFRIQVGVWNVCCALYYDVHFVGKKVIDESIEDIIKNVKQGGKADSFLAALVSLDEGLTRDEMYGNVIELMSAAVDTVSKNCLILYINSTLQVYCISTLHYRYMCIVLVTTVFNYFIV